MKKTVHLLILMALMAMPSFADKVSKSEAQRIAEKFMAQSNMRKGKARFAATPKTLKLSKTTNQDYAPFYVYNVENNGGFVIVSGEDALGSILGYSDSGSFEMENAPSNIVTMLQMFARAAENAGRQANQGPKEDAVPYKGNGCRSSSFGQHPMGTG
ncbi:Spi family protease inhibitor [Prevotella sp. HUN102]|uniref:Spi family protease inhibitor n=1 Tax=Prevotella sp. HUN102 TaxID=1392486 RepID=UPI001E630ECE|nr:Spi family protease inhibitor [Prevotella sp. HUN102]